MIKFIQETLLDKNGGIHSKKTNKEWFVRNGYEQKYEEILEKTSFLSEPNFSQRIYHIFHNINSQVLCPNCKTNPPTFDNFRKGYRTYCSTKCQAEHTKDKRKSTILEKYGEYPFINKCSVEKRKQTCLEKYGTEFPFQNQDIQNKQKETMFELYGVYNPSQLQEIKNKKVQTSLFNWGTEHPIQSKEINDRIKKTVFEKYGTDYFFESDVFKEKIKDYTFPTQSNAEIEIFEYLKTIIDVEIEQGNRSILNGKELDIFIKDKNLAIEYCGLYWHSNKFRSNSYHKEKFDLCNKQNIRLITIFEDEWIENKELIKLKLAHILNCNQSDKVFARKCSIKPLSKKEKTEFYNKYHIQGDGNSSVNIGLYYNEEIVSSMSFKQRSQGIYELDRYATKYIVVGGFNKLLNHFKINFSWEEIITFADLRWHLGEVYENSQFIQDKIINPDYNYIINNKRIHKFNFRKSLIKKKFPTQYDDSLTEAENMRNIGILKIYDCGKIRFKLTNAGKINV